MAEAGIETSFRAAVDSGKINGAVICATDTEGRFVYEKAWGERTLLSGEKRPQQLDDILFLASATKLITTIAALQCVEDGLITLEGDVSSIVPELAAKQVITGFSDDGETPRLESQARPITLEMLLTHSSGETYTFVNPLIDRWDKKFGPQSQEPAGTRKRPLEEAFCQPLGFHPGTGWMYGPGLDWAGRIVERVTGKMLGERMHERIFGPLGITDAQFHPVTRSDLRERLVDLNPKDPDARGRAVLGGHEGINAVNEGHFGGHGLFMTAPDFLKVLHSLLAGDGNILTTATVDDMFKHHLSPQATESHLTALQGPFGATFRTGTAPGSKVGFGLGGLLTLEDADGWYGERTLAWGGGRTLAWFIDRKNGLCGIAAIQCSLPFDHSSELPNTLKQTFRRDIYRQRALSKR